MPVVRSCTPTSTTDTPTLSVAEPLTPTEIGSGGPKMEPNTGLVIVNPGMTPSGAVSSFWMVCTIVLGVPSVAPPVGLLNARFTVSSGSNTASGQKVKTACLMPVSPSAHVRVLLRLTKSTPALHDAPPVAVPPAAVATVTPTGPWLPLPRVTLIETAVDDSGNAWVALLNWMTPTAAESSFWMVCTIVLGVPSVAPPVGLDKARFTVSSGSTTASGQKVKTACLMPVSPSAHVRVLLRLTKSTPALQDAPPVAVPPAAVATVTPTAPTLPPERVTLIATAVDDSENVWVALLNWMVPLAPSAVFV